MGTGKDAVPPGSTAVVRSTTVWCQRFTGVSSLTSLMPVAGQVAEPVFVTVTLVQRLSPGASAAGRVLDPGTKVQPH